MNENENKNQSAKKEKELNLSARDQRKVLDAFIESHEMLKQIHKELGYSKINPVYTLTEKNEKILEGIK